MTPLTLCIIAPAGSFLGTYLSSAIIWLYNTIGFVGVSVLSALLPIIVMTGMHTAFVPYLMNMYSTVGYDPMFMPASIVSNLNQGIACIVVAIKTKSINTKSIASSCAVTALIGGVTEPAMFGITLKYKTPLYGAMIGSFVGGAYIGFTNVYNYALGSGGLFGLPTFIGTNGSNIINCIIGIGIGAIVTFIATFILYKDQEV